MEFEFDKEIDAILRKARVGEAAASFNSHLDADDISAFAENALPEKMRQNHISHLADCTRCRTILSNVIELNSAAEAQTVAAVVPQAVIETSIPWYRRLFAMPNLAYTMGALVLVFGGFLGVLVLQNTDNSASSVATINTDKQMPQTAPNFPSESSSANTAMNTNSSIASGVTSPSNTTAATNTAPDSSINPSKDKLEPQSNEKSSSNDSNVAQKPQPVLKDKQRKEEDVSDEDTADLARTQATPAPSVRQPITGGIMRAEKQNSPQDDKGVTSESETKPDNQATMPKTTRSIPGAPNKKDSPTDTTRQVSGKTFKKVGGTWFDSEYGTQKQISVKRGTKDYQKLDSGVRSIADQFSGTVVVLWKSKAYRIQ